MPWYNHSYSRPRAGRTCTGYSIADADGAIRLWSMRLPVGAAGGIPPEKAHRSCLWFAHRRSGSVPTLAQGLRSLAWGAGSAEDAVPSTTSHRCQLLGCGTGGELLAAPAAHQVDDAFESVPIEVFQPVFAGEWIIDGADDVYQLLDA